MYKIVFFRYESVIPKKKKFAPPPNHKSVPTALVYRLLYFFVSDSLCICVKLYITRHEDVSRYITNDKLIVFDKMSSMIQNNNWSFEPLISI